MVLGLAATAVLLACSAPEDDEPTAPTATLPTLDASPSPMPDAVPGEQWTLREDGDFGSLETELAADATSCVAVVRDGELVEDRTWGGEAPVPVYSITKSITAVLVLIAAEDGDLALDDPVARHVPAWRGTPSRDVTVRDVMANVSGREWTYDLDYGQMVRRAADKTAFAVGLGQDHPPGEHWEYNNSAVQVLSAVLEAATGESPAELAADRLFGPLGMTSTRWPSDPSGRTPTFSGVESTCRDLARFGLLLQREGRWGEDQVLPADVLAEATDASSELNAAYGLLFWTNHEGRLQEVHRAAGFDRDPPPREGRLAPKVPADAFWAFGYGNQYVAVVPSEKVVAVRLGRRPATPDRVTFDSFTAGVLDALR